MATEHIPDIDVFSDERSKLISERLKQYGHDIEMSDLIYRGERSHVIEYLTGPTASSFLKRVRSGFCLRQKESRTSPTSVM